MLRTQPQVGSLAIASRHSSRMIDDAASAFVNERLEEPWRLLSVGAVSHAARAFVRLK